MSERRRPDPGDLFVQARPIPDTVTDWPMRLSDEGRRNWNSRGVMPALAGRKGKRR